MKERKYKITTLLERLPFNEVALAKKFLINQLKITEKTFARYGNTEEGDAYEIPANHLVQLSSFFGVKPEEMYTTPIQSLYLNWVKAKAESQNKVDLV